MIRHHRSKERDNRIDASILAQCRQSLYPLMPLFIDFALASLVAPATNHNPFLPQLGKCSCQFRNLNDARKNESNFFGTNWMLRVPKCFIDPKINVNTCMSNMAYVVKFSGLMLLELRAHNETQGPCLNDANAGVDGELVVGKLLEQENTNLGYDAAKGEYVDMLKAGIIDPLNVIRTALVEAASGSMLLTKTEAAVLESAAAKS